MSSTPESIVTGFIVETYNSKTGVWSRAEGPHDENTAYEKLDEVKHVIGIWHERGRFLDFTQVRMMKVVTKTTIVTTETV